MKKDEKIGGNAEPEEGSEKSLREKKLKRAILACGILAAAMAGICVWQLARFYGREKEAETKMEQLRQNLDGTDSAEETNKKISDSVDSERGQIFSENPYEKLFAQNEDMAAWLVVDGTVIDYPVMQTMEDEIYYLKRDFDGNEDEAGCLILDTDSDLYAGGTTNLIIHAHNMKTGTMFGSLDEYQDEDYYSEHKYMELYTETGKRRYEVMAALYDTGVTAELGDCFLTLSTCTYHVEDGRFVVVAKEIGRTELHGDEFSPVVFSGFLVYNENQRNRQNPIRK